MEFDKKAFEEYLNKSINKWSNRDLLMAGILDEELEDFCEDIHKFNNFINRIKESKIVFNDDHINGLEIYMHSEKLISLPIPIRVQLLELSIDR